MQLTALQPVQEFDCFKCMKVNFRKYRKHNRQLNGFRRPSVDLDGCLRNLDGPL